MKRKRVPLLDRLSARSFFVEGCNWTGVVANLEYARWYFPEMLEQQAQQNKATLIKSSVVRTKNGRKTDNVKKKAIFCFTIQSRKVLSYIVPPSLGK